MTTTDTEGAVLLEADEVGKYFGNVHALSGVSLSVRAGQVTCVLGDNGAGKSTLIKILSGVFTPDEGQVLVDGAAVRFHSPRDARAAGVATVFQDLAMVPLMAIWRNFYLGSEPTRGWGPWRRFDVRAARERTREALAGMGIDIRDPDQPVGTLSGGERQSVAIARAVHFGARVLILDEPTSALGVKQAGVVLRRVAQAREKGLGVVFITHNPHHAYPVGDRFVVLNRGRLLGDYGKADIGRDELVRLMSGGAELEALGHELERISGIGAMSPEDAAESGEAVDGVEGGEGIEAVESVEGVELADSPESPETLDENV
jgi:simple sugar transport system ATP-binding protein